MSINPSASTTAARPAAEEWEPVLRGLSFGLFRFELDLAEPVDLPVHYGSTLRGGLGAAFKRLVCVQPQIEQCRDCPLRYQCAYPSIFETPVPLHLADAPHLQDVSPYVLRPLTAARSRQPLQQVAFHLLLFGKAVEYLPYFVIGYNRLGERLGLGKRRTRFTLQSVVDETPGQLAQVLYDGGEGTVHLVSRAVSLWDALPPLPEAVEALTLTLETPARLKSSGKVTSHPTFGDVVAALLRRVEQLARVHGDGAWPVDTDTWLAAAAAIELVHSQVDLDAWQRFSGRQKQSIRMGGAVGTLDVRGHLKPFLPLLLAGEITHVGRGTAFGNGQIRVRVRR